MISNEYCAGKMPASQMQSMTTTQQVLDEVNAFLDSQTCYVEETLERLDGLRAAVIRRDEGALEKMHEEVQQETRRKEQYEKAIGRLRQSLAGVLNCAAEQACLSRLCERLESPDREVIARRQSALQSLIRRLNNEVRATESLLHECARFNRLLLNSLFGDRQQTVTYDNRGLSRRSVQGSLMNMRF